MIRFLSRSISRKILASLVGIYATTYLLTAGVVFTTVRASILDAEANRLSQLAEQKFERLTVAFRELEIDFKAWSELEVMNDLITGDIDKRVARTLEGLKRMYTLEGDIFAFDVAGRLVASSSPQTMSADLVRLPQAWRVGDGTMFLDKHPNPLGSGDMVALTIPVFASFSRDYRAGSLVLTYPWQAIERLLFGPPLRTVLLRKGMAPQVLATDMDAAALPQALSPGDDLLDGGTRPYVAGYSTAKSTILDNWQVVVLQETRVAVRSVHRVAWQLLWLGIALSFPLILGVRWLSRRLTDPVVALTGYVREIADTDRLDKLAPITSNDELGTLAQSFNRMTESLARASRERENFVGELESLNQTLEAKVIDRTKALEGANQELTHAFNDLKAAQTQLVQSEKMASLGQLVAGVAHELNNPIAFIYANFPHIEEDVVELIVLIERLRQLPFDGPLAAAAEQLVAEYDLDYLRNDILKMIGHGKDGASRIKEIVLSLRSFSRLDEGEFKEALLEDGLNDTLAILRHHMKGRITVEKDYQLNAPVSCYPGQVNQVFMNIIFNAIQATEGPGTVRLSTRRDGPWAVVAIDDDGPGIPPEIRAKIFDPFFTTKKVGEGTGLGLSISYGIMEKHGGRIEVESEPGKGSRFTLWFKMNNPGETVRGE